MVHSGVCAAAWGVQENQAAHWRRLLPSPGGLSAEHGAHGAHSPSSPWVGTDEKGPPRVPDVAIFARAMGCRGSKDIRVPLSLTRCRRYLFVFVVGSSLREEKKRTKKKSDRVLGPAKRRRGPPRSPVSPLSASQGLGVRPPTKCLCPKWTARDCPVGLSIGVGVATRDWPISALRC